MPTIIEKEIKKVVVSDKKKANPHNKKTVINKQIIKNPDIRVITKNNVAQDETINSDMFSLADYHKDHFEGELFEKASRFKAFISDVRAKGYYQYQRVVSSKCDHSVIVNHKKVKRKMIMMASNNYLELTSHPEVIEAGIHAISIYGTGSGGAPLLSGTMTLHKELEFRLARFKGAEDAVLFPSGYGANSGIISALVGKNDFVVNDRFNHASIIDGSLMSGGQFILFPHNNIKLLEKKLAGIPSNKGILVVVDGVFSMDGDIANLPEIIKLKEKYNFRLMIDEAHATGVIGDHGRGTASYFGLEGKIDLTMGTLSKAMGGLGGFLASSAEVVDYLRHYARSFFFSSSLPPATLAALIKVLDILERDGNLLTQKLHENSIYFRNLLIRSGLHPQGNPIIPIVLVKVGNDLLLRKIHSELNDKGIFVNAVPYPAVSKKESKLRMSVMVSHTKEELEITANEIVRLYRKYNLIDA